MNFEAKSFVGAERVEGDEPHFQGLNPETGESLEPVYGRLYQFMESRGPAERRRVLLERKRLLLKGPTC